MQKGDIKVIELYDTLRGSNYLPRHAITQMLSNPLLHYGVTANHTTIHLQNIRLHQTKKAPHISIKALTLSGVSKFIYSLYLRYVRASR